MNIYHCDIDFAHKNGEWCGRRIKPIYFFSCFSTPFLYEADGQILEGNVGDMLIIPPHHAIYHGPRSKTESFTNDWLYVGGDDISVLLERYPLPLNQTFHIENTYLLKNCIQQIQEELRAKNPGYEEMISCCITETIVQIHRLYQKQYHSDSSFSRIESVREIVLQNLQKEWTLAEMASISQYSISRFSSLYVKRFGLSPKADLIQNRIQLSKKMLRYSDQSITEIAKQCGFQSIYYFSKHFKEVVGMTPSEYAASY